MEGWWDELDAEIIEILSAGEPMETAHLAAKLRMSTAATASCLAMLSAEGRVRIRSVELPRRPRSSTNFSAPRFEVGTPA
jgi:hypothetical protein